MSGFTPSALVQWLHGKPLNEGDTSMRSELFIPAQYEVFAGLDVDKRSISVTFTNHQGFIRSFNWQGCWAWCPPRTPLESEPSGDRSPTPQREGCEVSSSKLPGRRSVKTVNSGSFSARFARPLRATWLPGWPLWRWRENAGGESLWS